MAIRTEQIQLKITADAKQVREQMQGIKGELAGINEGFEGLTPGTAEYSNQLSQLISKTEQFAQTASFKELRSEYNSLRKEVEGLAPGTEEYVRKSAQLDIVRDRFREVGGDIRGTKKNTEDAGGAFDKLKSTALNALKGIGAAIAITFSFQKIKQFFSDSINAYDQQQKALKGVEQALKSTNGASEKTFEDLKKQAADLQKNTLFGDEVILRNATQQLLTFTNIAGDNFDRVQKVALDVATVLDTTGDGTSRLKDVSIQLGKALNDPVANLGALSRAGIQFTKEQKEQIKVLVESNRLSEAQGLILGELEKQYGGQAAAALTGKGAMQQFTNTMGDFQEIIGGVIVEGINPFVRGLSSMVGNVNEYLETPLSEELEKEQFALSALIQEITSSNTTQENRIKLINQLNEQYPNLLDNLDAESVSNEDLAQALKIANDQYTNKILLQREIEAQDKLKEKQANIEIEKGQLLVALRKQLAELDKDFQLNTDLTGGNTLANAKAVLEELKDIDGVGFFTEGDLEKQIFYIENYTDVIDGLSNNLKQSESDFELLRQELGLVDEDFSKIERRQESTRDQVAETTTSVKSQAEALKELSEAEKAAAEALALIASQKAAAEEIILGAKAAEELEVIRFNKQKESIGALGVARKELTEQQLAALEILEQQHQDNLLAIQQQYLEAEFEVNQIGFVEKQAQLAEQLKLQEISYEEYLIKQANLEDDNNEYLLERKRAYLEELKELLGEDSEEVLELQGEILEEEIESVEEAEKRKQELYAETVEKYRQQQQARYNIANDTLTNISNLTDAITEARLRKAAGDERKEQEIKKRSFKVNKALGIAEVGINLGQQISNIVLTAEKLNALLPGSGLVYKAVQIPLALATSAANIATIASQKFAKGGVANKKQGIIGGNSHALNGTTFYGTDGSVFEAERDELITVVNAKNTRLLRSLSAINAFGGNGIPFFARGGVSFNANQVPEISALQVNENGQIEANQNVIDYDAMALAIVRAQQANPPLAVYDPDELQRTQSRLAEIRGE